MSMKLRPCFRMRGRQEGFTLLESAIALLVIGLGILGPLKMMTHAVVSSSTANARSIAASQAGALASMVQANMAFWREGEGANASINLQGGAIVSGLSPADGAGSGCDTTTVEPGAPRCTAAALAAVDLVAWARSLDAALPDASGTIQCTQAPDRLTRCTISVYWHERFFSGKGAVDASVSAATATADNSPRSFITYLSF